MNCDTSFCASSNLNVTYYDECCSGSGNNNNQEKMNSGLFPSLVNQSDADLVDILHITTKLLSQAPPKSNYLSTLITLIRASRFPPVSFATYVILIFFSVLHFITLIIAFVTLLWPLFLSKSTARLKRFWMVKLIPVTDQRGNRLSSIPLILINSGALIAFSQVIECILSQVYIYLTFFSSKNVDFAERIPLRPWACGITLCQFYSCWFLTWTSICTRIYSHNPYIDKSQQKSKLAYLVIHPMSLNVFFCIVPAYITVSSAVMIYRLTDTACRQYREWKLLSHILEKGAIAWDSLNDQTGISPADSESLQLEITAAIQNGWAVGIRLTHSIRAGVRADRIESYIWVITLSITCAIYTIALSKLLGSISDQIKKIKPVEIGLVPAITSAGFKRESGNNQISYSVGDGRKREVTSLTGSRIQDVVPQGPILWGFRYLTFYGLLMISAMICTIVVRLILAIKAHRLAWHASWRGLGSWLTLISGAFAALSIAAQCLRMILDFDIIIPVQKNMLPPASHLNFVFDEHRNELETDLEQRSSANLGYDTIIITRPQISR